MQKIIRKSLLYFFLFFIICSLTGCNENKIQPIKTVVIILFDATGSTNSKGIRDGYFEDYQKIVEVLTSSETTKSKAPIKLVAGAITDNPLAQATFPVNVEIPAFSPWKYNERSYASKMASEKSKIIEEGKKLVYKATANEKTDIINSFAIADRVFQSEGNRNTENRVLIVFSDMINQSSEYDFFSEKLTPKRIKEIIDQEKKRNHIPDLGGAKIWILGAAASEKNGLSPNKILDIQNFWFEFAKAANANLDKGRFTTRMIDFGL